jgi:hypothetical protein
MQTLKPTEIDQAGGKHVEEWLRENGFINVVHSSVNDITNVIEANGTIENILVSVYSIAEPGAHHKLDDGERSKLKGAAESMGRKAYLAYVTLKADSSLATDINWQRIS